MYCWSKGMDKWHRIYKVFPEVTQRKVGKPILPPQPMGQVKLSTPKTTYHVSQKGQILGPYPKDKIKQMHHEGRIHHDAKVCKSGSSHWVSLTEFLGQAAVHVPPPPPPPVNAPAVKQAVPPPPPPPMAMPPAMQTMAVIRYHLNTNGTVYGPATEAELYAMYCNGYVNASSCVCPLGGVQWFPIAQAFVWAAGCAPQTPPPITPQATPPPFTPQATPPPFTPQAAPPPIAPQATPMAQGAAVDSARKQASAMRLTSHSSMWKAAHASMHAHATAPAVQQQAAQPTVPPPVPPPPAPPQVPPPVPPEDEPPPIPVQAAMPPDSPEDEPPPIPVQQATETQAESENKQFYLYLQDEVMGPLSEAELHAMYYKGELSDQELTCQDGSDDWLPLNERFAWVTATTAEGS